MKPKPASVDDHFAAAPAAALPLLRRIRKLALRAADGAEERFSYGMPAVFVDGRALVYFAAFKNHVGVFPPPRGDAAFMRAIAPYAGPKGNLSFPFDAKVPDTLLKAIIAVRIEALRDAGATAVRAKPKAAPKKTTAPGPSARSGKTGDEGVAGSFARRARWPMPAFVKRALQETGLANAYRERPPYQRNDYVGWIINARTPATKMKRLAQMLDELERGGVYMRMKHPASARVRDGTTSSRAP